MELRKILTLLAVFLPLVCLAGSKEVKTVTFKTHLHCENCVKKVVENISFVKGVKDLDVSLEKQEISIKFDASKTDAATLASEIRKLGYPAEKLDNENESPAEVPPIRNQKKLEIKK